MRCYGAPTPSSQPYSSAPYGAPPQPYGTPAHPYGAPAQPYGAPAQTYGASTQSPYAQVATPYGAPQPSAPYGAQPHTKPPKDSSGIVRQSVFCTCVIDVPAGNRSERGGVFSGRGSGRKWSKKLEDRKKNEPEIGERLKSDGVEDVEQQWLAKQMDKMKKMKRV